MEEIKGRIHSVETCGTVDGPGIRFVVFMQGCPLRCCYCHNPDTWDAEGGKLVAADSLMYEAGRYASYMRASGGGITVSGGEPLLQPRFVEAFFIKCRGQGMHTALDTSGVIPFESARGAYDNTDLVLLDFKAWYPDKFEKITGAPIKNLLRTCDYLENKQKPVWIRFVLIPGLTDDMREIEEMAEYLGSLGNIGRVEINPFHKMGEYKWRELGLEYTLYDAPAPSAGAVRQARDIFAAYGLNAD